MGSLHLGGSNDGSVESFRTLVDLETGEEVPLVGLLSSKQRDKISEVLHKLQEESYGWGDSCKDNPSIFKHPDTLMELELDSAFSEIEGILEGETTQ